MSRKGIVELEIVCQLGPDDLRPWDELTPEQQEQQRGSGPGCDGEGDFGGLCIRCPFCLDWETTDSYEVKDDAVEK
jgi:hypothetical protein